MAPNARTMVVAKPDRQELIITRTFDAPRVLVFNAFVDPSLYVQWLGPQGLTTTLTRFEPYNGGSYRYVHRDVAGNAYAIFGVYHEVRAPERIVSTFEAEGAERGQVHLAIEQFAEAPNDQTTLTAHAIFQSVADRDAILRAGAERGAAEGYARLDALLRQLTGRR